MTPSAFVIFGADATADLLTEAQNPHSAAIDSLPTFEMLRVINAADQEVATAVERELLPIAMALDLAIPRLEAGGRLFYLGAGTSGRLGVLDASECPPTFNTPPDLGARGDCGWRSRLAAFG